MSPLLKKPEEKKMKQISIAPAISQKDHAEIKLYMEFAKLNPSEFFNLAGELYTEKNNLDSRVTFEEKINFKFPEDLLTQIEKKSIPLDEHFLNAAIFVISKDKEFKDFKKSRNT